MARKCRHCKTEIPKTKDCTEPVKKAGFCTIDHMAKHGIEKAKATREKKERVEHRKAKEKLKSVSDWTKEAQKEFNRFVRLDDYKEGCISCNRTKEEVEATDSWVVGGCWDAGHFRSRGAASHLKESGAQGPSHSGKRHAGCDGHGCQPTCGYHGYCDYEATRYYYTSEGQAEGEHSKGERHDYYRRHMRLGYDY